ncbi:MAG: hypothetical protein ACSW71_06250 [Methanobrevibacter sp.]
MSSESAYIWFLTFTGACAMFMSLYAMYPAPFLSLDSNERDINVLE